MEEKYSINEILNAVNEINEVKVNTQIKVEKKSIMTIYPQILLS